MMNGRDRDTGSNVPAWHALLAPLPADAVVRRYPVAHPDMIGKPEAAAIAGWESLTVELSAGAAGMRVVTITLDANGQPVSAGDTVLYRVEPAARSEPVCYVTENIGGRLEEDGSFRGTRWRTLTEEIEESDDHPTQSVASTPTDVEVAALLALVAEILRRG